MSEPSILLVFTSFPDAAEARRVAYALVAERLAACVNVLAPAESVYRWEGEIQQAAEVPAILKTTAEAWPRLRDRLTELHPYQVPEILAVPAATGLPAYLDWVAQETTALSGQ